MLNEINEDLLKRTEREAIAGAKIVFWAEANALVMKEDEAALIERGRELAATDEYQASENVLVALVPTQGVKTVYSRMGDWSAWLCLGGVAWSIFKAATFSRRREIALPVAA